MPDNPDEIYKALVADLAHSVVPTTVMGLTILAVGGYVYAMGGSFLALFATITGCIASIAKIMLMRRHRRFNRNPYQSLSSTRRLERLHAGITLTMAASIGIVAAVCFIHPDISIHVVATALVFGYASGIVCRVSVRPWIAASAVMVTATPAIIALASTQTAEAWVVSLVMAIFALGSMETIAHTYRNARGHILARLLMTKLARRDPLTELANRLALEEAFARTVGSGTGLIAVHAFDLDGFKLLNDQHGHAAGDQLLKQLAGRLRTILKDDDIASRVGGDEFVVLQVGARSRDEVAACASRIHHALTQPYEIGTAMTKVGVSLGYSFALREDNPALQDRILAADLASYRAKQAGGGIQPADDPQTEFVS
ncbi:GGDEF domain-containing protein [Aureimonas altamirensis]|uniref:GGDEF domain-containing protein n=1 Tax=Aureimonas altamirensis TaxID=370622 RepID=UPI001E40DC27|nr:GGDEF domain-containing protein [Aureimonas altamirensis]UHD43844.1 GGDEF domain-containing protein [Aureimonas altamirensis]